MEVNLSSIILLISCVNLSFGLRGDDCEVCIKFLTRFKNTLDNDELSNPAMIEGKFKDYCKEAKGKDNRFCYYLGGLEESATKILSEMSKPLSWSMPVEKVCEKLKKKDGQICDLKYDKDINWDDVNLKKLKVRDLKKILSNWGEICDGCLEKTDYIKRIEELKPKYVHTEL